MSLTADDIKDSKNWQTVYWKLILQTFGLYCLIFLRNSQFMGIKNSLEKPIQVHFHGFIALKVFENSALNIFIILSISNFVSGNQCNLGPYSQKSFFFAKIKSNRAERCTKIERRGFFGRILFQLIIFSSTKIIWVGIAPFALPIDGQLAHMLKGDHPSF